MGTYPCAGCGRVVVVAHVLCVECELRLDPAPITPRLALAAVDQSTALVDATLIVERPRA